MASLVTTLGLRAASFPSVTPNHAAGYLTFNWFFAYCVLAPRHLKQIYGIDNNVSPRDNLAKYGEAAVKSGKITQKLLDMMKRNEAAQANSIEGLVVFVGALSLASIAGVDRESINLAGLTYTISRIAYGAFYIFIDRTSWSYLRSTAWWGGNLSCLWLLRQAGRKFNVI